ncbi:MAG: ATP-binding protein [Bacteroidetes bacterium]|nr:ATP-binding protein [Bacteroidota bacterium]
METKKFFLELQSIPDNLYTVEEFLLKIAEEMAIEEDKLYGIMLSVSEATTNAIFHANKQNPDKTVTINITVSDGLFVVSIKDQGPGFNPTSIPDPTKPENLLKDSGRGLFLMRIYSKSLSFTPSPFGTETVLEFEI